MNAENVAGFGLDDRQRGERTSAEFVRQLGSPFEQTRVQVEHVAGERFAPWRATQQQRNLTVSLGLLGKVVVNNERVLAVFHPVLAHGAAAVRGEELERSGVRRRSNNHGGVLHGSEFFERGHVLGNGRSFLTNRDVDALNPEALLVQDRVEANCGLAGLAVADDQLSLTSTHRDERIDRLDAGLHRLVHGLTTSDARSLNLHASRLHVGKRTLAVDGLAEWVDHTAQQTVAYGH